MPPHIYPFTAWLQSHPHDQYAPPSDAADHVAMVTERIGMDAIHVTVVSTNIYYQLLI